MLLLVHKRRATSPALRTRPGTWPRVRSRRRLSALLGGTASAFLVLNLVWTPEARADIAFGGDFVLAWPAPKWPDSPEGTGFGLRLRLGWDPGLDTLLISPEVNVEYVHFPSDVSAGRAQRVMAGRAGLRLGYKGKLSPQLLLHVGYAGREGVSGASLARLHGMTWDIGLGLDYRLLRWLSVGTEFLYHSIEPRGLDVSLRWLSLSFHGGLHF